MLDLLINNAALVFLLLGILIVALILTVSDEYAESNDNSRDDV